jgi:hypothetical protein
MASSEVPEPATSTAPPEVVGSNNETEDLKQLAKDATVDDGAKRSQSNLEQELQAIRAHKGHRNLLIRGCCTTCMTVISIIQIQIPKDQFVCIAITQFFSACTLFVQWRRGNPWMFIGRAITSWVLMLLSLHTTVCGNTYPWEFGPECTREAWDDPLLSPLRVLHLLAAVRYCLNGLSLLLQFLYPTHMLFNHGNQQLFFRGWIQASNVIVHLARYLVKRIRLDGTWNEADALELQSHWLRMAIIAISAASLWNQWWLTGKRNTGHPLSDAYLHLRHDGSSHCHALTSMHEKSKGYRASA